MSQGNHTTTDSLSWRKKEKREWYLGFVTPANLIGEVAMKSLANKITNIKLITYI